MNVRQHARWARELIDACGGPLEAQQVCRLSDTQLSRFQTPNNGAFMPADVIADLERHCGRAIYSRALFEAVDAEASEARQVVDEACEAAEEVAGLQREIRLATQDGKILTPTQRDRLNRQYVRARNELDDVGRLLAGED